MSFAYIEAIQEEQGKNIVVNNAKVFTKISEIILDFTQKVETIREEERQKAIAKEEERYQRSLKNEEEKRQKQQEEDRIRKELEEKAGEQIYQDLEMIYELEKAKK